VSARWHIVRLIVGLPLIATAGLKLYGLSASAVPQMGWFSQPWVQLLAAEWELVLGAWLLSGVARRASWVAALGTFAAFAGVSGYLGWQGVASCGCFGAIKANPWWAFGVDVVVVAVLAASRPPATAEPQSAALRTAGIWAGAVSLVCAALVGAGSLAFGSVEAVVAKLRGDGISAGTSYIDFGAGRSGETLYSDAVVANWTNEPVRLVGGTSDCSCATTDDFPLVIPPNGKANFRIRLKVLSDSGGQLTRTITIHTDHAERPQLTFRIGCKVTD